MGAKIIEAVPAWYATENWMGWEPMEKTKKRKLNPIWAHVLASLNLMLFIIRYGGSKGDVWVNWSTGEVTPVE